MRRLTSLLLIALTAFQPFVPALAAAADPKAPPAAPGPDAPAKAELLPPAAIGWGNLLVPGLGATLSDRPLLGLTEATLEVGSFYGGTLLAPEGRFKIDGSVIVPDSGSIRKPVAAAMLQQFGLKYHFYNTFYHYQQAVLAQEAAGHPDHNPQPIYRGSWQDILSAPFKWKNLSTPWTWPVVLGTSAFLVYSFSRSSVVKRSNDLTPFGQSLYGANQIGAVPVGSSFGEDPLFRGFIQREMYGMTGSLPLAIATQSALFALLHEDHLTSAGVGIYFGIEANALHGDLEPIMAAHFWINVVIGLLDYWTLKRSLGTGVPFNPPISASIQLPF